MPKPVTTRWLRKFYESDAASPAPPATVSAPPTAIQPAGTVAPKRRFLHVNEYLDAARRGLTKAETAIELGITRQGVHMAGLRYGISFAKRGARKPDPAAIEARTARQPRRYMTPAVLDEARALRAGGKSWGEIAEVIGFGRDSLKTALSRAKLAQRVLDHTPSESPAVLAEPSGGQNQIGLNPVAAFPSSATADMQYDEFRRLQVEAVCRALSPSAVAPVDDVSRFKRTALSLSHFMHIEEARAQAALELDRRNSPRPSVAADRVGITQYFPNPKGGFRLSAPSLLGAAPSRDRRVFHVRNIGHGEHACPGAIPTETFGAKR